MSDNLNFYRSFYQTIEAIEFCLEKNFIVPALCLIYSGIDSIAWIAYGDTQVKERFVKFVLEHMYAEKPLGPRPIDIYAARCAVLHTMTPDSKLSNDNNAVPLAYSYGNADPDELQKVINILNPGEMSAVHLKELTESFRLGIAHFVEKEGSAEACQKRMKKHYATLTPEVIKKFNEV